ncbi:MAG: hypothetical protein HUU54_01935 [Ignavibacteriaceae bacterium]|nr:hypothetical protein [Ignavibacteriaceae bacterium]
MSDLDRFYLSKPKDSPYYIILHVKSNGKRIKKSTKRRLKHEAFTI